MLRNSHLQPLALSLSERRGMEDFLLAASDPDLEARGLLDRRSNISPDDMQLAERRRSQPFTRPELSVLLAYAKLTLYDDLLESTVPDDRHSRPRTRPVPQNRSPNAILMRSIIIACAAKSSPFRPSPIR